MEMVVLNPDMLFVYRCFGKMFIKYKKKGNKSVNTDFYLSIESLLTH